MMMMMMMMMMVIIDNDAVFYDLFLRSKPKRFQQLDLWQLVEGSGNSGKQVLQVDVDTVDGPLVQAEQGRNASRDYPSQPGPS